MAKKKASQDEPPFPYMDGKVLIETRVSNLLGQLTLDEKIDLLSGATSWSTHEIARLDGAELADVGREDDVDFAAIAARERLIVVEARA